VHGLLKTEDAVSRSVSGGTVLISLISFVLIYGALMAVDVYLLTKYAKAGPSENDQEPVDSAAAAAEASE
jgi:cytochrome d ubiquinol oxidase subunit I